MPSSHSRTLALTFLALSISSSCAARGVPEDAADGTAGAAPTALLELTNATLAAQLAAVASVERVIIFTTTSAFLPPLLNMTRNWFMHVHKVGRGANSMVISQDPGTCASLLGVGIPCYLDRASPQEWQLPEGARYQKRPFDFGKIWWSLRFAELGYTSMYMDNDVVLQEDPIRPEILQSAYDIQGLSDFRGPELPALGGIIEERCPLYGLKKDDSVPGGDVLHPLFEITKADVHLRALVPCQSLGAFYVAPTSASQRFLSALAHWVMYTHPHQWDQAAWNELMMAYLVGVGSEEPLRFRLLPVDQFMNAAELSQTAELWEVWDQRHAKQLPLRPVLIHTGYLKDSEKSKKLRMMGLWAADEWHPSMAPATLKRSLQQRTDGSRAWLLLAPIFAGLGLLAWKRSPSRGETRGQDGIHRRTSLRR